MTTLDILIRLLLATFIGFIVGFERERHHRPAGMKTHIMVCVGATIVSMIQIQMVDQAIHLISENPALQNVIKADYGRLGAQVISGIGFLGAGTILQKKGSIKGLTTAATLWLVACVGLAVGMGYYKISLLSIVIVMCVLVGLRIIKKDRHEVLDICFLNKKEAMGKIQNYLNQEGIELLGIDSSDETSDFSFDGKPVTKCTYTVILPRMTEVKEVVRDLMKEDDILFVVEAGE